MLYLIHGEEPLLCAERVMAVRAGIQAEDPLAEFEILDAQNASPTDVVASLTAISLFTTHRVITVKGAAGKQSRDERKPDAAVALADGDVEDGNSETEPPLPVAAKVSQLHRLLQQSLARIPAGNDILFFETVVVSVKSGLGKILHDEAVRSRGRVQIEEMKRPRPQDVPAWLRRRAEGVGMHIEPAAVEMLSTTWAKNLTGAQLELEKLRTFVGESGKVTREIVALLAPDPSFTVFELVDAAVARNVSLASRAWESLISQDKAPMMLLFLLVRQFRMLLYLRLGDEAGIKPPEEALRGGDLALPPWLLSRAIDQSRRLGGPRLRQIYRMLLETEGAIKQGKTGGSDHFAMERLLIEICAPEGVVMPAPWTRSASS